MTDPRLADDGDKEEKDDAGGMMKRLLKARAIFLSEAITDKTARRIQTALLMLQQDDEKSPITVYINSPGGHADSGFAIYDFMRFVKPPVRSIVTGMCASAAVLPFLAVSKERRYSLPNARFLLHQPSTVVQGSASDVAINAEEILRLRERYNTIVSQETGKSVDQVTKDADRDFWLSPGQAKEYGLVGKIVKTFGEMDK
ncbi:MAG TPA: ATP-dependent Clp protease proteolytic subunit [Planctomycetota bacterium]|nr:ATP-dependent Clp protease proteolytic subunit [Planctomycetota bacterium]